MSKKNEPKIKKYPHLNQIYLLWDELVTMRTRHTNRRAACLDGRSNLDAEFETDAMEALRLDAFINFWRDHLVLAGAEAGMVWYWLVTLRGLKDGSLLAQTLAQYDDISNFATNSKFWRYSGYAVIDGKIDRPIRGKKLVYNKKTKSTIYLVAKQFIQQRTYPYRELYDDYYAYQRKLHPDVLCTKCEGIGVQKGQHWFCGECGQPNKDHALRYTPGHIDARATRYIAKRFLQHLWVVWRTCEGLPVSDPWIIANDDKHNNYMPPPNWPLTSELLEIGQKRLEQARRRVDRIAVKD